MKNTPKIQPPEGFETCPKYLLQPQIPKPLHGVNPRSILGSSWWNKTRKAAYGSTNYHCKTCGVSRLNAKSFQRVEGHEVYNFDYQKGQLTYLETIPLCHYCHNYIHQGRLHGLMKQGKVNATHYVAVIKHGDRVVKQSGIDPAFNMELSTEFLTYSPVKWDDWRLCLDGKFWPPLYKNYTEWKNVFKLGQPKKHYKDLL